MCWLCCAKPAHPGPSHRGCTLAPGRARDNDVTLVCYNTAAASTSFAVSAMRHWEWVGTEVAMDDRAKLDPVYFSMPTTHWPQVGSEAYRSLSRVNLAIGLALTELEKSYPEAITSAAAEASASAAAGTPAPADLAFQMHEVAGELLAQVAGDEQDLRQIIGTLRTALAVCWDLYSIRESERVTVSEHMHNLKGRIEDFERELRALRLSHGDRQQPEDSSEE